jgi:glycosyltransferase involved in cell wall biosynthesis
MTELVALRQTSFRSLVAEVDHIVAMCQWVKDLLMRNGVPADRITMSRQGLWQCEHSDAAPSNRIRRNGSALKIMFVGRLDPTKGAHVLIDALKAAPGLAVTLDIYGVTQGEAGAGYLGRLKQLAEHDGRITFRDSIPSAEVVTRMRDYDALAVPSQWLETGPMVVMEAFAARLPVIGSNLGGIAELVTHGVDGLLVEPRCVDSWRRALEMLCEDRSLLTKLRDGIRAPRSIADVAGEMSALYARLLGPKNPNNLKAAPNRNAQPQRPVATSVAGLVASS